MNKPASMTSPIETERDAAELPEVRAVRAAWHADPGVGKMAPHNLRMMLDVVGAAGVQVGAYDVHILEWLAGFEPETCAVVAGLITRAADLTPARKVLDEAIAAYGESLGVPQQDNVTVQQASFERAARLAGPMGAEFGDDGPCTVQDVIDAALRRGLDALEKTYGGRS